MKYFNTKIIVALATVFGLFLVSAFSVTAGPVDTYVFQDKVTEIRFNALNKELRCPKCQNQNLADSNSPIAKDLRREVYEMLNEGKADMEITDYMVKRYGEFVLYRPRVNGLTYVLWFGPALFIIIGLIIVIVIVKRKPIERSKIDLSNTEQSTLDELLQKTASLSENESSPRPTPSTHSSDKE
jgi:cytochrome c-type biogenesis protein CcmH